MNGNEIIATTDHTIFVSSSLHDEVGKWEELVMTYYDSNNGCIWDIGENLSTKSTSNHEAILTSPKHKRCSHNNVCKAKNF